MNKLIFPVSLQCPTPSTFTEILLKLVDQNELKKVIITTQPFLQGSEVLCEIMYEYKENISKCPQLSLLHIISDNVISF